MTDRLFRGELFFAKRLHRFGIDVFAGDTTSEVRKARIRNAIVKLGIAERNIGTSPSGQPETWAQSFERLYSEPVLQENLRRFANER